MGMLAATAREAYDLGINLSTEELLNDEYLIASEQELKQLIRNIKDKVLKKIDLNIAEDRFREKFKASFRRYGEEYSPTEFQRFRLAQEALYNRTDYIDFMSDFLSLQNKVNTFLDQRVQMIYVYVSSDYKETRLYATDNAIKEYTKIDNRGKDYGGYAGLYEDGWITNNYNAFYSSNMEQEGLNLQRTYEEANNRYDIGKKHIYKDKKTTGNAGYILWKEGGKWDGAYFTSKGPLGEAYLNFLLSKYQFSMNIESAIRDFVTNEVYGAKNADSTNGFLEGDVSRKITLSSGKTTSIEFGVKTNTAHTLGYVEVLKYLTKLENDMNLKEFLLKMKEDLEAKGSKNMVQLLEKNMEDLPKGLFEGMEAHIRISL